MTLGFKLEKITLACVLMASLYSTIQGRPATASGVGQDPNSQRNYRLQNYLATMLGETKSAIYEDKHAVWADRNSFRYKRSVSDVVDKIGIEQFDTLVPWISAAKLVDLGAIENPAFWNDKDYST